MTNAAAIAVFRLARIVLSPLIRMAILYVLAKLVAASVFGWNATSSLDLQGVEKMWLLSAKPPRARKTCDYCNGGFGCAQPNYPFCKPACKQAYNEAVYRPPDQYELPLHKPPDAN